MNGFIFNPQDRPIEELPLVYGFNNGDSLLGFLDAVLLAEDGACLYGHTCSTEGWMPSDLGIAEHGNEVPRDVCRRHYPHGFRMEFVRTSAQPTHTGLQAALRRNDSWHLTTKGRS